MEHFWLLCVFLWSELNNFLGSAELSPVCFGVLLKSESNRSQHNDLTSMDPADTLRAMSSQGYVLGEYDQLIRTLKDNSARVTQAVSDLA